MAGDVIVLVWVVTLWQGGGAGGWHLLVGRPPTRWSLRSRGAGQESLQFGGSLLTRGRQRLEVI